MVKEVYSDEVCDLKYIYLDWNVIRNIMEPRDKKKNVDIECRQIIEKSNNIYIYPYCEAHFMDRTHNYKEELREKVLEDLLFFEKISRGYGLARKEGTDELGLIKYSALEAFESVLSRKKNIPNVSQHMPQMEPMHIKIDDIRESSLFIKN